MQGCSAGWATPHRSSAAACPAAATGGSFVFSGSSAIHTSFSGPSSGSSSISATTSLPRRRASDSSAAATPSSSRSGAATTPIGSGAGAAAACAVHCGISSTGGSRGSQWAIMGAVLDDGEGARGGLRCCLLARNGECLTMPHKLQSCVALTGQPRMARCVLLQSMAPCCSHAHRTSSRHTSSHPALPWPAGCGGTQQRGHQQHGALAGWNSDGAGRAPVLRGLDSFRWLRSSDGPISAVSPGKAMPTCLPPC